MRGLERLPPEDTALLLANLPAVRARLITRRDRPRGHPGPLDIDLEEVVDAEQARAVIAALPDIIGLDLETCGRREYLPPAGRS